MPWRVLPIPIGIGMLAHGTRWLLMAWGASPAAGALAASFVAGLVVTPLAARLNLPFAGFAFASVVSLVPGLYLFEAAAGLMELISQGAGSPAALLVQAVTDAMTALLIVLGMTTGLVLPRLVLLRFLESVAGRALRREAGRRCNPSAETVFTLRSLYDCYTEFEAGGGR